ncbi:menaquinone-dependent protoporphyrinogen IX dehydrogenase [Vibrio sp. HA2012]|uniref:menaquinone-dependent protoporphyrinogen IX dehydrogenase n=1 Tax=Vibrio sp. HA2012 TaxID=1971595 RepID=UPI000C2C673D|nr:menaquinone-dependent protoporphyrinogen IX dehydrogenase [Vibrio sp. HA2012]PJC85105.1 menaquinone-dependent protoporphyrinogen IX dehydrogenase [Vibrio sp. HA2012]
MKKVLCLYSTTDGQTIKIFKHIQKKLVGYQSELMDLHEASQIDFTLYDRVIIGASVRYGRLNKKLYQFIERNRTQLQNNKVAFFCVNLTARKEAQKKDTPEGSVYIKTFLTKSLWKPELIGVFAGALRYPKYKWLDRLCIQLIMKITGGETDTSKEVEYTNWKKVSLFAILVADM